MKKDQEVVDAFNQGLLTGTREEHKRMKAEFKKALTYALEYAVKYGEGNSATYLRQFLRRLK